MWPCTSPRPRIAPRASTKRRVFDPPRLNGAHYVRYFLARNMTRYRHVRVRFHVLRERRG